MKTVESILSEVLEPIRAHMEDPSITEIQLRGNVIWIRSGGKYFECDGEVNIDSKLLADQCAHRATHQDSDVSEYSAELDGGQRVHVVVPPITEVPHVIIRKHNIVVHSLKNYVDEGMMSDELFESLREDILCGNNIILTGEQHSGKTHLLRSLITSIPNEKHIVAVHDIDEIGHAHPNMTKILARRGLDVREDERLPTFDIALQSALRLSPNVTILSEIRGLEALTYVDMVTAGQTGVMATLHANPHTFIDRMCLLMMKNPQASRLGVNDLRYLVGQSVDAVYHISVDDNHSRKIEKAQF